MEPVVTINLNGNPYQLDQSAYDALKAYLDAAERALGTNPDKAEIMRDLEQAIADKCAAFLSAHKTVVSAEEMKRALDEMGPVDGEAGATNEEKAQAFGQSGAPRKRIYRIRDGAQIAGVCAGIGAYLDMDANLVRLVFIILAVITSGAFFFVYVILMFVIPSAHTSEEWAAAHGVPFNAQDVIDEAKRKYADFAAENGPPWYAARRWRKQQRRAWKQAFRDRVHAYAHTWPMPPAPPPAGPVGYVGAIFGGFFALIFGLIRAALTIAFLVLLFTLVTTGSFGGYWPFPPNVDIWQAAIILMLVYVAISIPLRALRWAAYGATGWRGYYGGGEALVTVAVFAFVAWFAYTHIPEAHAWMDQARIAASRALEDLSHDLRN